MMLSIINCFYFHIISDDLFGGVLRHVAPIAVLQRIDYTIFFHINQLMKDREIRNFIRFFLGLYRNFLVYFRFLQFVKQKSWIPKQFSKIGK